LPIADWITSGTTFCWLATAMESLDGLVKGALLEFGVFE
jgi:hypothetical protein